jgi:hypothetical protein
MNSPKDGLRENLKTILQTAGLLNTARWVRRKTLFSNQTEPNGSDVHRQRFLEFKRSYEGILRHTLNDASDGQKKVLVISMGFPEIELELGLIKGLELAGYTPFVIDPYQVPLLMDYYELAAIKERHYLDSFADPADLSEAEAILDVCATLDDLLAFEYEGVRVGRFAVSTALRWLRLGTLDFEAPEVRPKLIEHIASSIAYTKAALKCIQTVRPEVTLLVDAVYTPQGEIFDVCLTNGVDVILWDAAHKSNTLMMTRYTRETIDQDPNSLSPQSWEFVQGMEWTEAHRQQLQQELYNAYAKGDWYSANGTQFKKRLMSPDALRNRLGLDPNKKTACIFPHILWDASLFWSNGLFESFEAWLIETVRTACANDQVNWVIKIHPAHVGKNIAEGVRVEPAEVVVLREHIGELPPHIFFIPADSDINTYNLFEFMDYCITVCGTVGIEASSFGIPVLTAGNGRYDSRGFTVDSKTREQYLERMAHIQDIPPLSAAQRELAERFAYGTFILRPLPLSTVTLEYPQSKQDDQKGNSKTQIKIKSIEEWATAPDLRALAEWVNKREADFLQPLPEN